MARTSTRRWRMRAWLETTSPISLISSSSLLKRTSHGFGSFSLRFDGAVAGAVVSGGGAAITVGTGEMMLRVVSAASTTVSATAGVASTADADGVITVAVATGWSHFLCSIAPRRLIAKGRTRPYPVRAGWYHRCLQPTGRPDSIAHQQRGEQL